MDKKAREIEIVQLVKRGLTYANIGQQIGLTRQRIHQIANKGKKVKTRKTSYTFTKETGLIQTKGYGLRKPIRKHILERDGYKCHYCSKELVGTDACIDHKIPRCKGGTHDHSNLVASCKKCNGHKMIRDYETFKKIVNNEKIEVPTISRS